MKRRTLIAAGPALLSAWMPIAPARAQPAPASGPPAERLPEAPMPSPGGTLPPRWLAPLDGQALLGGGAFSAAQAEGRVLVLYWWASWCPFCALVSPEMDKLWRAQAPRGLQLLGLSIDRRPEDATAYLQRRGYGFPNLFMTPALQRAFPKPKGLPVTVVRGKRGEVLMAEAGQLFPEDVAGIAQWL
jgi:thiol-disulfide isomerase/thioredoxin